MSQRETWFRLPNGMDLQLPHHISDDLVDVLSGVSGVDLHKSPTLTAMRAAAAAPAATSPGFTLDGDTTGISDYSHRVIQDAAEATGLGSARVTSTTRTPASQARAMYDSYLGPLGLEGSLSQYKPNGDAVLRAGNEALVRGGNRDDAIAAMTATIQSQLAADPDAWANGHLANPAVRQVIDLSYDGIKDPTVRNAFIDALTKDPRVARTFNPTNSKDPAIHLEIPQPRK